MTFTSRRYGYVRIDGVIMDDLGHARAAVFDAKGLKAEKAGDSALAIRSFEQASKATPKDESYAPSRTTLSDDIRLRALA